ncbi:hypothetical protein NC652_006809 [Populus alba x Populus x berolinensis]|nr:hypothetical protein NC652_006809 [Populus alba x Populus x berolinensis]
MPISLNAFAVTTHNCTDQSPPYFDDNWKSHKELSFAGTNKNVLQSQRRRRKGTQGKGYLLRNVALLPTWGLGSEGHEPKREEVHIAPAKSLIMCSWATLLASSRIVQMHVSLLLLYW